MLHLNVQIQDVMTGKDFSKLEPKDIPLGRRSRTDLSLASFGEFEGKPSIIKSYHEPSLPSNLRRMLSEKLVSSGYVRLTPEDHVSHEVSRLKTFAEHGIAVPQVYAVTPRSFTMELIPYPSAEVQLDQGNFFVINNVLQSLQDVHSQGLTHGDFFPANIIPVSDQKSVIIDPGYKFEDQDTTKGKYRDLAQLLFRLSHHIYELVPVLRVLKEIYQDQKTLIEFTDHLQKSTAWQRFLTNLVFRDGTVFARTESSLKKVFGQK